ncbi:MAG: hypothetical protein AB7G28_14135 [Pirellulales bacterium]
MLDVWGSIAMVGAYSLVLCGVFAQQNGWQVGLKFYFVVTTLVAATVTAWVRYLPHLSF